MFLNTFESFGGNLCGKPVVLDKDATAVRRVCPTGSSVAAAESAEKPVVPWSEGVAKEMHSLCYTIPPSTWEERESWSLVKKVRWVREVFIEYLIGKKPEDLVDLDFLLSDSAWIKELEIKVRENSSAFYAYLNHILASFSGGAFFTPNFKDAIRYSFTLSERGIHLTRFVDDSLVLYLEDDSAVGNEALRGYFARLARLREGAAGAP